LVDPFSCLTERRSSLHPSDLSERGLSLLCLTLSFSLFSGIMISMPDLMLISTVEFGLCAFFGRP